MEQARFETGMEQLRKIDGIGMGKCHKIIERHYTRCEQIYY